MKKIIKIVRRNSSSIFLILFFTVLISLLFIFRDLTINVIDWILNNMLIIATIFLGFVTWLYYTTSRRIMWHQSLLEFQKEYRKEEMMEAVQNLWSFYRDICERDEEDLLGIFRFLLENNIQFEERLNLRKLEYFYFHLAILNKHKILKKRIIFDMFHEWNLKIIPKIIIPLSQELQDYVDEKDSIEPTELKGKKIMLKLYEDSKKYKNDRE